MSVNVVTCRAPRQNGEPCGAFVAQVPWGFAVVGFPTHSRFAREVDLVAACSTCGTLHEIRRSFVDSDTVDGVA